MSNELDLNSVRVIGAPELGDFGQIPQEQGPTPITRMHLLLTGRYKWFILLALIFSIGLASAGYFLGKPLYQADALIRVSPVLQHIMKDDNGTVPMFDSLIDSQVTLIKSSRVIELARQSPEWRALNRGTTPLDLADFMDHLKVDRVARTEHITVSFMDKDPNAALIAVKTVTEAYMKIYGEQDSQSMTQKLNFLEERRTSLNIDLKNIQGRIMTLANDFGSDSLDRSYEAKLDLVNKLEGELQEVRVMLAATTQPTTAPTLAGNAQQQTELMAEQIAVNDPVMREYIHARHDQETKLAQLKLRYGSQHPLSKDAEAALDVLNQEIARYADDYKKNPLNRMTTAANSSSATNGAATREELVAREKSFAAMFEQAKAEMLDLGRKNLQIKELKNDADVVRQRLDETKQRIDQLNMESAVSGRITAISTGDLEGKPAKDPRKMYVVGGTFGGSCLSLCIMLLIGMRDPGIRNSTEVKIVAGKLKILGSIPVLPRDLADPEQAAIAAHGVHHIRGMLQLIAQREDRHVMAITSPAAGTGKTSLTLSLGVSMAASGTRTLIIDCDLIGAGLTARVNTIVRRKIGRILQESGAISPENLQAALAMARKSRKRLGEMLLELGYIEEAKLTSALAEQGNRQFGIIDAIEGEELSHCIAETGIPNLAILPVGSANSQHVGKLSPASLRKLLIEARKQYDMVLVDTGPILGSLEASLLAAAADGVVLTMSRGEQRPLAERAVDHLHSIGANVIGIVFNRAENRDTQIYSTASMSTQLASRKAQTASPSSDLSRFGPIALAVASSVPNPEEEESKGAA